MPARLPKIAVVILNWNGKKFLEQFIPSILRTTYANYELWVADNGSNDDSVSFLTSNYPNVKLILLDRNYGFAKGYNEALKQISSDYYVLLNSDVEVTPNWLEPMVELCEKEDRIAACQPKLLAFHQREKFEYAGAAGGWLDKFGYPFAKGRVFDITETDQGQYDDSSPIFWASGAALFIRANVFHEMRGFDEYFFAHQEEIDLCWRIQLSGYRIFSCPQSVVYHVGGGTLPRGNSRKTYLNFRNNKIMLSKNLPFPQKLWVIGVRNLLDGVSAWKGLINGDPGYFVAIIRSHMAFVKWWLFHRHKSIFPQKKGNRLPGVYRGNIAWLHFVKKKKLFTEIVQEKDVK